MKIAAVRVVINFLISSILYCNRFPDEAEPTQVLPVRPAQNCDNRHNRDWKESPAVRTAKQQQNQQDSRRRTGSHHNTIGVYRHPVFLLMKSSNFLPQFRIPQRVSVMSQMRIIRFLGCFGNTDRNIKSGSPTSR